jgi:uncharacterized protein YukE
MGVGNLVSEAISAAEGDMTTVQAAADAISDAIGKVKPWLTTETWEGDAATAWAGEWTSFYRGVQNCLSNLQSAETDVVSAVRTQMTQIITAEERKAATA